MSNKTPAKFTTQRTEYARTGMISIFVLAVINCFYLLFTDAYFVLAPYFSTILLQIGLGLYEEAGAIIWYVVPAVFSVLVSALFLVCGLAAKKRFGWMIVGTVLYGVDTLLLLWDVIAAVVSYGGSGITWYLPDILIHIAYIIIFSIALAKKKDQVPAETTQDAPAGDPFNEGFSMEPETTFYDDEKRQITFRRDKCFYASGVTFTVTCNGETLGTVKNGGSFTVTLPANAVTVEAGYKVGLSRGSGEFVIPAGNTPLTYRLVAVSGAVKVSILFVQE